MNEKPVLILDADDTLWENNVYYEEVNDAFAARMAEEGFDRAEARRTVDRVEHERVPLVGYGVDEFVRSVVIAYHCLCERHGRPIDPQVEAAVETIAQQVIEYPIVLLDGVAAALPVLERRFRLLVLTKGCPRTQHDKVERSGLGGYFEAVHVVAEKGPEVLHDLIARHGLDPERTWMVGNSPRSDINPALEAGLGAIYVPYSRPWAFEDAAFVDPERVVTLASFGELVDYFGEEGI